MNNKMIMGGVIAVILIGGAFYGGMMYQQSKTPARGGFGMMNGTTFAGQMGRTGVNGSRGMGAGVTAGEILLKDTTSITLRLQDGSTKIILTSASTTVMKSSAGTFADLAVGTTVNVVGMTNTDGSVTAQSVQLRPAGSLTGRMPSAEQ